MRRPGSSPSPPARGAGRAGINCLGRSRRSAARPRVGVGSAPCGRSTAPPTEDAAGRAAAGGGGGPAGRPLLPAGGRRSRGESWSGRWRRVPRAAPAGLAAASRPGQDAQEVRGCPRHARRWGGGRAALRRPQTGRPQGQPLRGGGAARGRPLLHGQPQHRALLPAVPWATWGRVRGALRPLSVPAGGAARRRLPAARRAALPLRLGAVAGRFRGRRLLARRPDTVWRRRRIPVRAGGGRRTPLRPLPGGVGLLRRARGTGDASRWPGAAGAGLPLQPASLAQVPPAPDGDDHHQTRPVSRQGLGRNE